MFISKKENRRLFFNFTNHELNNDQLEELKRWEIDEVVEMPQELKKAWGEVTPCNVKYLVEYIVDFVKRESTHLIQCPEGHNEFDETNPYAMIEIYSECFFLIQGHFGATVSLVEKLNMFGTPMYAHSERLSIENPDGSITKQFKHQGFYRYYDNTKIRRVY